MAVSRVCRMLGGQLVWHPTLTRASGWRLCACGGVPSIPHVISRFSLNLDVPALDDDAAMADDADAEAGKARDSAGAGAGGSEPAASAATGGASAGERGDQAPAPSQGATAEASASNGGKEAPALAPAPLAKVPPAPAAPQ